MQKYLELSVYQLRKKSNIFTIIIISIASFLIIILGTYLKTYNNLDQKNAHNKTIMAYKLANTTPTLEEQEEIIQELSNFKNVTMVVKHYAFKDRLTADNLQFNNANIDINFEAGTNKSIPKIVKGSNFPDNEGYYMVCPENFYPTYYKNSDYLTTTAGVPIINTKITRKDKMPEDSYFDKIVHFKYQDANKNSYETDVKIVGLFKNEKNTIDETFCYLNTFAATEMMQNKYAQDTYIDDYFLPYVQVNQKENLPELKNELKARGFAYEDLTQPAPEIIATVNKYFTNLISIIIVFSSILIFTLLIDDFKSDKNQYQLFHYLGYTKKEICKIYYTSTGVKLIFCMLISCLMTLILMGILEILFWYYPFFLWKWQIFYNFEIIFLIIAIIIILVFLTSFINLKKIKI